MEEANSENSYKIASGFKRLLVSAYIDLLILWLLPGVIVFIFHLQSFVGPVEIGSFLILYVIGYYTLTIWKWGKSLGYFITKIHVIKADGSKPGLRESFLRAVCMFNPWDWLSFYFYKKEVFWCDKVTNTLVVEDEKSLNSEAKKIPENIYQPLIGEQDKKSSKIIYWVFWIGLALIAILFCFGMFQVYKMSKSFDYNDKPQVTVLVDQYIQLINQDKADQAYGLLSDSAKSKLTLDQFTQKANVFKEMSDGYENQDTNISSSLSGNAKDYMENMTASYTTKINFSDGTGELRANLSKINGQWKIEEVNILSHTTGK